MSDMRYDCARVAVGMHEVLYCPVGPLCAPWAGCTQGSMQGETRHNIGSNLVQHFLNSCRELAKVQLSGNTVPVAKAEGIICVTNVLG